MRLRRSHVWILGAVVILASAMAGCSGGSPTATPTSSQPTPTSQPEAKVFRIGLPADITTTNVWSMLGPEPSAYNFYVSLNHYPTLYALSDQRFDWVPEWADGFPTDFVQEGSLWTSTVKIKAGTNWSDGQPVTADDFVFTWQTVRDFELPGAWQTQYPSDLISNIEAVDQKTLKFSLNSKPGLAQWPFVAKHFWEPLIAQAKAAGSTVDDQRTALYAIVPQDEPSAGEMVAGKRESGAFAQVTANDSYFFNGSQVLEYENGAYVDEKSGVYKEQAYGDPSGSPTLSLTRGPHVGSVIFNVYASQAAAVLAMQNGDIDYIASPVGLQPGFQAQLQNAGIRIVSNVPNSVRYLGFNTRRAPMDSKAFRQAVAILIDKEFLTSNVLQGAAEPAYTMVPPGNGAWYNPNVKELGKDMTRQDRVTEAVKLLKDAGFTWATEPTWDADNLTVKPGSGMKMPNGQPVPTLELLAPSAGYDPMRSTFGIWTERWLQEVGIPVKLNLTGSNAILSQVFDEQDFDMWILGWGLEIFPGYLGTFFSSDRAGVGDYNAGGYSNAEFDQLAKQLNQESDLAAAKQEAFRLQEILADEVPYVVLFTTQVLEPVGANVEFPFDKVLDGVQNYLQYVNGPLSYVNVQ